MPFSNLEKSNISNRLLRMAKDAATITFVSSMVGNNPPDFLLHAILNDCLIHKGKLVPGNWLGSISSKSVRSLLFCLAVKSSGRNWKNGKRLDLETLAEVYVDDLTINEFMEEIFPICGVKTKITGNIFFDSFSVISNKFHDFHTRYCGNIILSQAELRLPPVREKISKSRAKVLNKDVSNLTKNMVGELKSLGRFVHMEGITSVDFDAISDLEHLSKCKLGIRNHHLDWDQPGPQNNLCRQLLVLLKGPENQIVIPERIQISNETAEKLSKTRKTLVFYGLNPLTKKQAGLIANHRGWINFMDAEFLDPELELELSGHAGAIVAENLRIINTVEFARKMSNVFLADGLKLNMLVDLTAKIAREIAEFTWDLSLNGIHSLNDETTKSLSFHKGLLQLNGLLNISETGAENLLKKNGIIQLNSLRKKLTGRIFSHDWLYRWILAFRDDTFEANNITHLDESLCKALLHSHGFVRMLGLKSMDLKAACNLASSFRGSGIMIRLNGSIVPEFEKTISANKNLLKPPF